MKWRTVPGFSNYEVSDTGLVRTKARDVLINRYDTGLEVRSYKSKILKNQTQVNGYVSVRLKSDEGSYKTLTIHRLVMLAFVGPSPLFVLHADDDPKNNHLANLRYGTRTG